MNGGNSPGIPSEPPIYTRTRLEENSRSLGL